MTFLLFSGFRAGAQITPPPASYVRSYVNDLPDQPLVTVAVTGTVNVACFTIEEIVPGAASAHNVSGGGVWLPALGVIRWGPFFNTIATNVSYRLTGLPGSYPVNGGAWMDGQWYFSPGSTIVAVLPTGGGGSVPSAPPQVASPTFTPPSGGSAPTTVTISCATPGAVIYYTVDGSLPTRASTLYTGAVSLGSAGTVRAVGFTNGWTPSAASVAYYGPPAVPANGRITRYLNTNSPTVPLVTFSVVPGTNAACVALTELLAPGLSATNVTAGGHYVASNNVVLWGPFFGTNAQTLSYQAMGQPGSYPVRATWSVDGVGGAEAAGTNLLIASTNGQASGVPTPPPQVAAPTFSPASGGSVPVNLTMACATPGATIYYTLDGSLPTTSSWRCTGAVSLATASTVRAVGFTNGWTPSAASVAYYGPPAAPANAQVTRGVNTNSPTGPVVTLTVEPGTNASCLAVTELLPAGLGATNVSAGGNYLASNNVVVWGPFLGTNTRTLSYQAVGPPGTYAPRATWSVDGVSGSEAVGGNMVVAPTLCCPFPTAPSQEPTPTLSPASAANLPVSVAMASSDAQAEIHFTTDGSLPTTSSALYTTPLNVTTRTTLRARAFRAGYLASASAVGDYVPLATTNGLLLVRSVTGNGTFLPAITVAATPPAGLHCYAVTEVVGSGVTPSGLSADAVWNPTDRTIRWGPYLDRQPRALTYHLSGPSGTYSLAGQGSFDGYPAAAAGATMVTVNTSYPGSPDTTFPACSAQPIAYDLEINPAPQVITVTSASGTVDWGDGTQSAITQPVMTLHKQYAAPGTYPITVSADWIGRTMDLAISGHATKLDTVQVVTQCNPVIVVQPSNQVVLAGATAQFSVTATSFFPMSFQWFFNRTNPIVSPATFSTLTLPNVGVPAAGLYSVLITNAYGAASSGVASLSVVTPLATGLTRNADQTLTLHFVGLPNSTTYLWAATNLASPIHWEPVFTNHNAGPDGAWQFTDTKAIQFPARFYRFSTPQAQY